MVKCLLGNNQLSSSFGTVCLFGFVVKTAATQRTPLKGNYRRDE